MDERDQPRAKTYASDAITVRFEPRRCIHAARCVFGLPDVFDPGRRPWIDPARAAADSIARVVALCPTGALHFERRDGGPAETPDAVNRVRVTRNGPLHLRGRIELRAGDGSPIASDLRVALCRCGGSRNPPFCDNRHVELRFADRGEVAAGAITSGPDADDPTLRVTIGSTGPYTLAGPLEIESGDGRVRLSGTGASLCRCGRSRNKPFCDGSHEAGPAG